MSLSQRLTLSIATLRGIIAARGGRDRALVPLLTLVWTRLGRMAARFEALMARVAAGRPVVLRRPRIGAARIVDARIGDRPEGVLRLPTGRGWLIRLVQETAQVATQFEALLADPEMVALLAAAPNAGRIFRPLYQMFLIAPGPGLVLSASARPAPRPRPVKPAEAEPPLDEASVISLVWASLRAQGAVVTSEPVPCEPPWRRREYWG